MSKKFLPKPVIDQSLLDAIDSEYLDSNKKESSSAGGSKRMLVKVASKSVRGKGVQEAIKDDDSFVSDEPLKNLFEAYKRRKVTAGRRINLYEEESDSVDSDDSRDSDFVYSASSSKDEELKKEEAVDIVSVKDVKKKIVNEESVRLAGGRAKKQKVAVKSEPVVKEEVDEGCSGKALYQRVPPKQFMAFVQGMRESHKQAIRDIGFGGFLHLDIGSHNSEFCAKLVRSVNVDSCSLVLPTNKEIDLEEKDFELVYGLPRGGIEIDEREDGVGERWISFLKDWRELFGLKNGSPTISAVFKELEDLKNKPVCDDFIWHFLLCAVNCCIRSTNNQALKYRFLSSCLDVKQIANLNWCGFAYKHLLESVSEWQEKSSYFTGSLPFLMIFYFDRLQRGDKKMLRICPLTSVWTKNFIKERINVEKNRGFGVGKILKRLNCGVKVQAEAPKEAEEVKFEEGSSGCSSEMLDFMKKFQDLAKRLANDVNEMSVMLEKAVSMFSEGDLTVQMNTLIDNIWSKYRISKEQQPKQSSDKDSRTEKGAREFPRVFSQDHHLFNDPAFMDELDAVMAKAIEKFKNEKGQKANKEFAGGMFSPNFDLLSQSLISSQEADEAEASKNNDVLVGEFRDGAATTAAPKASDAGNAAEVHDSSVDKKMSSEKDVSHANVDVRIDSDDFFVNFDDDVDEDLQTLPEGLPESLLKLCKWGDVNLCIERTIMNTFAPEIFGRPTKAVIFRKDVHAVVHMNEITCSTIVFYMSHLHNVLKNTEMHEVVCFVDPNQTYGIGSKKTPIERSMVLMERFKMCKSASIFLLPNNSGAHWTLTVVDVKKKIAYWLDPLKRRLPNNDEWTSVVDEAIRFYYTENQVGGRVNVRVKWIPLLGIPEQKDSKTCGILIMRYMRDIVSDKELKFASKWQSKSGLRYNAYDLDQVRGEWADEVLKFSESLDDVVDVNAMSTEDDEFLDGKKDCGGTRGKRIVKLPAHLRSPFMVQSDHWLLNTLPARKRVVEYAFSAEDPDELLYHDGLTLINRSEISSLAGSDHVLNNVVDAWSLILNNDHKKKSVYAVDRFMFTTIPFD